MDDTAQERQELEAALEEMQQLIARYPALRLASEGSVDVGAHYVARCLGVKPEPGEAPLPIVARINAALRAMQPEHAPEGMVRPRAHERGTCTVGTPGSPSRMRLPPADLVAAMQPFRAAVLRKRPELWPELWPEIAGMDIQEGARHIAARLGQAANPGEATAVLLRRLTAAVLAEPVLPGPSPIPSVPAGRSARRMAP